MHTFSSWFGIIKYRLSITVALSSLAGYFMYKSIFSLEVLYLLLGIMLIASAVAIINQYQEQATDALMPRTCNRPLPSGQVDAGLALRVAIIILVVGLIILGFKNGVITALLGLIDAIWYNLVYTPLKKRTAFAVMPGAICGAIPPLMGWVTAGGYIWHPKIWILVFFFFIWQIPHFWLILLRYGKEYSRAGLPSVTKIFTREKLRNITFIWLIASGVSALFLPIFSMVDTHYLRIGVVVLVALYFLIGFWALYLSKRTINYWLAFITVNFFMICIIGAIIIDHLVFA